MQKQNQEGKQIHILTPWRRSPSGTGQWKGSQPDATVMLKFFKMGSGLDKLQ